MSATEALPAVCTGTVSGRNNYPWPCIHADGHSGDCHTHDEAQSYSAPLDQHDRQWLLAELRMVHSQLLSERRRYVEHQEGQRREHAAVAALLQCAATDGAGRSAKHGSDCWLRHVSCLARLALYRPFEIETALTSVSGHENRLEL